MSSHIAYSGTVREFQKPPGFGVEEPPAPTLRDSAVRAYEISQVVNTLASRVYEDLYLGMAAASESAGKATPDPDPDPDPGTPVADLVSGIITTLELAEKTLRETIQRLE